ncbi:MAG: hypothetical protein U5Q16_14375 [Gammaproteobacteria bacterium]|nr:hypothetical protein [Gammaproteobacteria bacterium]
MNEYAKWLERVRPRMVVALVFFVLALAGLFRFMLARDVVRYFSSDTSFRQDTESITKHLAGPYHIDIVYQSGESAGIYSERAIRDISSMVEQLRQHPDVVNVLSGIVDVLREVGGVMSGSRDIEQWTPEVLAQYFLSYELSLNIGQSTKDLMDSDHRRSRISVLLNDVSMAEIRHLVSSIDEWAEAEGFLDISNHIRRRRANCLSVNWKIFAKWRLALQFSVVISAILVGLYFRDWKASLSIFAATAIPILAGFGIWGWVESDIGDRSHIGGGDYDWCGNRRHDTFDLSLCRQSKESGLDPLGGDGLQHPQDRYCHCCDLGSSGGRVARALLRYLTSG